MIENKYKIQQPVIVITNKGLPVKSLVSTIEHDGESSLCYTIDLCEGTYKEDEVFETEEEFRKSLKIKDWTAQAKQYL